MSLVVAVKSEKGLVVAADTALSLYNKDDKPTAVFLTATKMWPVFSKDATGHRAPCVIAHVGSGVFDVDIEEIMASFCRQVQDQEGGRYLDPCGFTVEKVGATLAAFIETEHYAPLCKAVPTNTVKARFLVAGYGTTDTYSPEVFVFRVSEGVVSELEPILPAACGVFTMGDSAAVDRMLRTASTGHEPRPKHVQLPIPDCVSLARFILDAAKGYARFFTEMQTIGGGTDVCALSPLAGFKWLQKQKRFKQA